MRKTVSLKLRQICHISPPCVNYNFLTVVGLVGPGYFRHPRSSLGRWEGCFFSKCVTDNSSSRSSKCVSCLRFVFSDLQNQNWTLLPQPGFCKIYRTEMSKITLTYFLVSKHFPLKIVFHTKNISSSCCFPRTPTMAQRPCLKRHFLPSLLQITHGPMEREGLHGSSKTAERKFLNLKKAFHLPKSTVRPM